MLSFYPWIHLFCLAGQKNSSHLLRAAWWRITASDQPQNNWWSIHLYETNLMRDRSAFSSRTILTGQRRSEEKRVSCTFVFQRRKQKIEYYSLTWETALLGHNLGHQCNEITLEANLHGKNRSTSNSCSSRHQTQPCWVRLWSTLNDKWFILIQMNIQISKSDIYTSDNIQNSSSWHFSVLTVFSIYVSVLQDLFLIQLCRSQKRISYSVNNRKAH